MDNIIKYILINVLTTGSILTLIYFIFKEKIKAHIKLHYDKLLEDYKATMIQKQKAALIGGLVAEWISFPRNRKKLNQLTLEAFMWLPKETANKLSSLLSHSQDAPEVREIVEEVREIILGENERIEPGKIIIFPPREVKETTKSTEKK